MFLLFFCLAFENRKKQVLNNSQVIACTLTGAASDDVHRLPAGFFDLVVIDECAQALESACWIALLR